MTRAELLEELLIERFGTTPRPARARRLTPAEMAVFEQEHERAQQRIRRQQITEDT